ncbi:MAG: hypothetical protein KDB21_19115 [Acidimicrobiales bacterium]|nr:hypothetical protein [Acidimicrobiales bacterium]
MTNIWLTLDSPVAEVGETVSGWAQWEGLEKDARGVEVSLQYRTEGRGDTDRGTFSTTRQPAAGSGSVRFDLAVPAEGPITFDGRLIRVIWEVNVKLDVPWATDIVQTETITIFPRGGRTLWVQRNAPPPPPPPAPPAT